MPSKKTISVLVVCLAIIASTFILKQDPKKASQTNKASDSSDVVESVIRIDSKKNDDWKKILTTVDTKTDKIKSTNLADLEENDSTLTDQLSKDVLAQYLLAVKNGTPVSKDIANLISKNALSLPTYNLKPAEYIRSNLKITAKSDKNTLIKYGQDVNQAIMGVYYSINDDPMSVLLNALNNEDEKELKKLDPIIETSKKMIKKLLDVEVPEKAVIVHLNLLNNSSRILLDLESMRESLSDPIKSFTALSSFNTDLIEFRKSISNINDFLLKNSI